MLLVKDVVSVKVLPVLVQIQPELGRCGHKTNFWMPCCIGGSAGVFFVFKWGWGHGWLGCSSQKTLQNTGPFYPQSPSPWYLASGRQIWDMQRRGPCFQNLLWDKWKLVSSFPHSFSFFIILQGNRHSLCCLNYSLPSTDCYFLLSRIVINHFLLSALPS